MSDSVDNVAAPDAIGPEELRDVTTTEGNVGFTMVENSVFDAMEARIAELEEENTLLLHKLSEAEQYAEYSRQKALDDVLALPRKSHVFGHECIRVTDIEALRGEGVR